MLEGLLGRYWFIFKMLLQQIEMIFIDNQIESKLKRLNHLVDERFSLR